MVEKRNSLIYNSILKNGYSNFTFEILEYCTADNCINKKQYFIDLLKPDYNLLPKAGSSLGYKQTEESLAKMAASRAFFFFFKYAYAICNSKKKKKGRKNTFI